MIFQKESSDTDAEPSFFFDAELDNETTKKSLSSPLLFTQEREEPTDRRQTHHSHEENLLPTQSFCAHSHTITEKPVHELGPYQNQKSSRETENERNKILLEKQKRTNPL